MPVLHHCNEPAHGTASHQPGKCSAAVLYSMGPSAPADDDQDEHNKPPFQLQVHVTSRTGRLDDLVSAQTTSAGESVCVSQNRLTPPSGALLKELNRSGAAWPTQAEGINAARAENSRIVRVTHNTRAIVEASKMQGQQQRDSDGCNKRGTCKHDQRRLTQQRPGREAGLRGAPSLGCRTQAPEL